MKYDDDYIAWKDWSKAFAFDDDLARYYDGEFKGRFGKPMHLLEIGFGSGSFLAWAKSRGATMVGCELNQAFIEIGQRNDFDVRLGTAADVIDSSREKFDLIVGLDVLEHIPSQDLPSVLRHLGSLLAADGRIMMRVPNGSSPFGRIWQNGDLTHVSTLGGGKFVQFAAMSGLEVEAIRNAYRSHPPGRWGIKDRMRYLVRSAIEAVVNYAYFPKGTPLDPNIMVVMKNREQPGRAGASCPSLK
jgi:hypothetical protein